MFNITTLLIILFILLFTIIISFFIYKYFNSDIISLKTIEYFYTQSIISSIPLSWENLDINTDLLTQSDEITDSDIIQLLTDNYSSSTHLLTFTIDDFSAIDQSTLDSINYNSWLQINIHGDTKVFRPLPQSIRMFNLINANNNLIAQQNGTINSIINYTNTEFDNLKIRYDTADWDSIYSETPLSEAHKLYLQGISIPTTIAPPSAITTTPAAITTTPSAITTTPAAITTTPSASGSTFNPLANLVDDGEGEIAGL